SLRSWAKHLAEFPYYIWMCFKPKYNNAFAKLNVICLNEVLFRRQHHVMNPNASKGFNALRFPDISSWTDINKTSPVDGAH
ncbi:MAG: hypothetical protein QNJ46_35545, partial [Leptolyngbyaceae cyanobacterium MO_188.B28]|nr:hypothetical protein [Leptolyngbyaceae cyanobacterium MO_188.B28]